MDWEEEEVGAVQESDHFLMGSGYGLSQRGLVEDGFLTQKHE